MAAEEKRVVARRPGHRGQEPECEEHHQARWAGEIHQLREQVHALKDAAHRLPLLERELQDRSRELASAWRRIADLEAQLR